MLRRIFTAALLLGLSAITTVGASQAGAAPQCKSAGPVVALPGLSEASGLALSRRVAGRLWSHNDSGPPVLVALDSHGAVTGRVQVTGASVDDWEAVAVGPCPEGSCLYIADIGDNNAARKRVTIYRAPEPAAAERSFRVTEAFHATYPDGAHDAETLLVTPEGQVVIVTKGNTGATAMYRFPKELQPGATHRLERVGAPRNTGKPGDDRITDGAASADGRWIVLRTGGQLTFHVASELMSGNWRAASSVSLEGIGEAQGEGVAIADDGTVYLAGEGGGSSRPGTFARLTCAPMS